MKILIIEDEYNLADAISSMLKSQKYNTIIKTDGTSGFEEALTGIYDLIILDVMLPGKNGFEILKELKEEQIPSKVLMLTARSSIEDKLKGFDHGADDYLTKPFHMKELLARVNVQLRHKNTVLKDTIDYEDISLNIKSMELENKDNLKKVKIIGKEYQLLEYFMNNPKQILAKEQIFTKIWGYDTECDINTLEAYISFLRKKLKLIKSNINIKAIRNMGYIMEDNNGKIKK